MEKYASNNKEAQHYDYTEEPPQERRYSAQGRRISVVDDVFGEIVEGGPNYRDVSIALATQDMPQYANSVLRLAGWAPPC